MHVFKFVPGIEVSALLLSSLYGLYHEVRVQSSFRAFVKHNIDPVITAAYM